MRRFMLLFSLCASLLLSLPDAEAVTLSVAAPSENSRILAPGRDF